MWHILRAEFDYNKKLVLASLGFIPLICLYELAVSSERQGYVLLIIYGLTVFWNMFRNKEKRNCQLARLPLSVREVARARILMIVIAGVMADGLYYVTYLVFHFTHPQDVARLLAYPGIILVGFSIYFVSSDLLGGVSRKLELSKKSLKVALILMASGLQVMTVYAIIESKAAGKTHVILHYLDKLNMLADPPINHYEIAVILILSALLASLTVVSFGHRKSYLE